VDVPEVGLRDLPRRAEKATGFKIESYIIEYQGLCGDCAKK
jgi:Fe2+ or Zn2+ uptake regulation protein